MSSSVNWRRWFRRQWSGGEYRDMQLESLLRERATWQNRLNAQNAALQAVTAERVDLAVRNAELVRAIGIAHEGVTSAREVLGQLRILLAAKDKLNGTLMRELTRLAADLKGEPIVLTDVILPPDGRGA